MLVIHFDTSNFKPEGSYDEFKDELCEFSKGSNVTISESNKPNLLDICIGDKNGEPLEIFIMDWYSFAPRKKESSSEKNLRESVEIAREHGVEEDKILHNYEEGLKFFTSES